MNNMLYIRKLFTQDLRDGKQIAFPKEPSYSFFSFDYINKETDRRIVFTFKDQFDQFPEFDGKVITTRLYSASSESRIDGELKAFIRDELHAVVEDFLIFKNRGTKNCDFEVMFVPQSNSMQYPLLLELSAGDNHTVCSFEDNHNGSSEKNLQQIYYGAPGTGKSHTIKGVTEIAEQEDRLVRTTFHPDSDYSTFVGAYKPTKANRKSLQRMNLSLEDLAKELGNYYSNEELGKISGIQKFCYEYYPYIDGEYMSVNVTKLLELAGVPKDYNVEINKYIKFCHLYPKQDPDKITYEFVPQAFTKAYVKAWNTKEDIYLVIEEINRGNCAQIFGDLFQLLDRKGGRSKYPIDSDTDLEMYLSNALAKSTRDDFPEGVKEGKKLVLPENLYIWATMNTSDQSLFPIDSAFKRRWNWNFIKIRNYPEKNYKIVIGEEKYDWWSFIKKINEIIASMTSSADKQLGYFFCNPENGEIDEKLFVSKVIFYLWNDVFKDYGFEDASLFQFTEIGDDGKEVTKDLTFPDFYDEAGEEVNTDRLKDFLVKVENWKKTNEENS